MSMRTIERWIEVTNYSAETIATRVIKESGEYIVMTYIDGQHQERGDLSYNHPADAIDMAKAIRDNAESDGN